MIERDRKRLEALIKADHALYTLWKQSEIRSIEMTKINDLQTNYIQPAIREMEEKFKHRKSGG